MRSMRGSIPEVACKSALTRCGIPGVDFAVNPYVGCTHACVYCYASFMKRFTGHVEPWGTYVEAKSNVAEVLARQVRRPRAGKVMLTSVTDGWQPAEATHRLSRACLEALVGSGLSVGVLTKSDLVLRDLDVLAAFRDVVGAWRVSVGFSVTTLDDGLARWLEPGAPPPSARLAALEQLSRAGVPTWVFVAPVLPGLTDAPEALAALIGGARRRGAGEVLVDPFTFYPAAVTGLRAVIEERAPSARRVFEAACARPRDWRAWVRREAARALQMAAPLA
jgi:DNA repair photolyase